MTSITTRGRRLRITLLTAGLSLVLAAGGANAQSRHYDIPAQPLSKSLQAFGRASNVQIIFTEDLVRGRTAPALKGGFTTEAALDRLLEKSGLRAQRTPTGAVMIVSQSDAAPRSEGSGRRPTGAVGSVPAGAEKGSTERSGAGSAPSGGGDGQERASASEADRPHEVKEMDKIVVTGTRIRGIGSVEDLPAPAITVTREDFIQAGFATAQDIFRTLPQNFDSSNSEADRGVGNTGQGGNGVNLRGLGADSTMIMVNGRRRSTRNNNVTDIRSIPLGMLERVEIVTGGRSAMYGSDAVGGVVNFVTRRDFEGVEVQSQYGSGRNSEPRLQFGVLTGMKRETGGFAVGYDYAHEDQFDALETGLVANPDSTGRLHKALSLRPESRRQSLMAAGHVRPSPGLEIYLDALYGDAETRSVTRSRALNAPLDSTQTGTGETQEYNLATGLRFDLPASWQLTAEAQLAGAKGKSRTDGFTSTGATVSTVTQEGRITDTDQIGTLQFEGPLPRILNIEPRLAFGAEYRKQEGDNLLNTVANGVEYPSSYLQADRSIRAFFAEALVPLVEEGERPGLRRLQLSFAGRHERYSDFGSTFTPQAGIIWKPHEQLSLRGSYSRAFKAPALRQQLSPSGPPYLVHRVDPTQADNTAAVIQLGGSRPDLGPEKAKTWSVGFDFEPAFARGTKLSMSYFEIDYTDRIADPATGTDLVLILQREGNYAGTNVITRNPSAQQVDDFLALTPSPLTNSTSTPIDGPVNGASVLAAFPDLVLLDIRTNNIAIERVRGIDLDVRFRRATALGDLDMGLNGSYQIEHITQIAPSAPQTEKLNEIARPIDLRLRATAGLSKGAWSSRLYLNYVPAYDNPYQVPVGRMESWLTADLSLGLDVAQLGPRNPWTDGLRIVLSARNLLDKDPPLMHGPPIPGQVLLYDPTNATGEGRILTLRLMKHW